MRFREALDALWLAYQPIVSWTDRRVVAFEVLCRSGLPGLEMPADLLDEAERLGRVWELGRTVRALVADFLAYLPSGCAIFVNLHADDLSDPQLLDVGGVLAPWSDRIVLEITERRGLADLAVAAARTRALKQRGFGLALDDLGAGHSGLNCLAELAPDVVKLDRTLISQIDRSARKQALVSSIVELCRDMRIRVVAEGVETEGELTTLAEYGCDWMQGYLFGRPRREAMV
jgi:EAL domain-containing protein (putative c-di-GMP-specific phosphodiesterase class I)